MKQKTKRLHLFLIYSALAITTIIAFEPVRHNDFISFDDYAYVTRNQHVSGGITRESVIWAFTTPHGDLSYWQPLVWLSHMLDCQLFGLDPKWHHLTNLLFHTANTLLLFAVLRRITGAVWRSAFVAAAFALHPLRVESVAWVAERKDVLSVFFAILTIAAYAHYAARPGVKRYLLVVLLFCLGLMTKPMLVTVPFVLLLLDYWPLGRFPSKSQRKVKHSPQSESAKVTYQPSSLWRLLGEKVPLLILALISSVVTLIAVEDVGGRAQTLPLGLRTANVLVSYVGYVGKMFYPSRLAPLYPYPANGFPSWQPIACFTILACVSAAVLYTARRWRYLPVGWLWYLGTLVPVIGLVHVGSQAMADRFTYLPSIGILLMVAWGAADLLSKWRHRTICLAILAGMLIAAMVIRTRSQVQHWKDNFALYRHTLAVTENNSVIESSYGAACFEEGQFREAAEHFKKAVQINPKHYPYRRNLGRALFRQGKFSESVACFRGLVHAGDNSFDTHYNLGVAYVRLGDYNLAVASWTQAAKLKPDSFEVLNNLAWVLATTDDPRILNPTEAVELARRACELADYKQPGVLDTLAAAYAAANRFDDAIETAEQAVSLAKAADKGNLAQEIQNRLQLYKAGHPYRSK